MPHSFANVFLIGDKLFQILVTTHFNSLHHFRLNVYSAGRVVKSSRHKYVGVDKIRRFLCSQQKKHLQNNSLSMATASITIYSRLNGVLEEIAKQRDTLSSSHSDAFYQLIDERLKSRFKDFESRMGVMDKRFSQLFDTTDELMSKVKTLEDKNEKFEAVLAGNKAQSESHSEEESSEDPEEKIERLQTELLEKDILLKKTQEKLLQQQALFLDSLKNSETVIKQLVTELQGTPTTSSWNKNILTPVPLTDPKQRPLLTPRKSLPNLSPTGKATVFSQVQATVTVESEVTYPPGYNPNRRRGSVSAESPGTSIFITNMIIS